MPFSHNDLHLIGELLSVAETHLQETMETAIFYHGRLPMLQVLESALNDSRRLRLELVRQLKGTP